MHLEVIQNDSVTEQVTSEVIDKLYDVTLEDQARGIVPIVDSSSVLLGQITTYAAYKDAVDYLRANYPNLIINVNTYYIRFLDPVFAELCIQYCNNIYNRTGDNALVGCTLADLNGIISLNNTENNTGQNPSPFRDNPNIVTLDFSHFENLLLGAVSYCIKGNSNLRNLYINGLNGTLYLNAIVSPNQTLDRVIVNNLYSLHGWPRNNNNSYITTLAVKNFTYNNSDNSGVIKDYSFRKLQVQHLYIGMSTPPACKAGKYLSYGNVSNIYVPKGTEENPNSVIEAYQQAEGWSSHVGEWHVYDFDNDPDGIFSVFNY